MTAVPVPAAGERPVGREAELAALARAVEALEGGRGSVVEITGEPGIGKTRLALTLMDLAAGRGVPVVRAHALRGNAVPFQVLRDAWETRRAHGSSPSDASPDRPAEWAAGCVLVLDDLHWCDPDSAALLAGLVRSVVPGPLLLALVHRPGQTAPALREALEDGVRAGAVTRLEPGPLDRESVAALLAGWRVPTGVGPGLATGVGPGAATGIGPGVATGVGPGAAADDEPAAPAGIRPGTATGTGPGAPAGVRPGVPTSVRPGVPAGVRPGAPADIPPSTAAGVRPGAPTSVRPGAPADIPPSTPTSVRPGAPADIPPSTPTGIRPGAPAGTSPPDFAADLCAAAEGNPRHLRLLVAAGWRPELWPDRAGTDPAGLLREAKPLVAEFDALSERAAVTASAAAVVGSPFRPEDVALVSGLGLDSTLDALAELERADLVRSAGWTGGLAFRHPVVGHVAHERAGVSFRLRAHRRALELSTGLAGRAHERARHAEHLLGADAALAARTLAEGAAEIVVREPATAARWLRSALEALPAVACGTSGLGGASTTSTPSTAEAVAARIEMELACCRALIASGQWDEARARAHELLGDRRAALGGRQALQAHAVCANAERQLGRYTEAAAIAEAGLGPLPRPLPDPLPAEAVELITEFGLVHVLRGTHDQARDLLREALRTPATADEADLTVLRVLNALCATHAGDLDEAADEVTRCARLVDALPDPLAGRTPETLALLGSAELYLERFADAGRHLGRGLAGAESGPLRPILLHRLLGLAAAELWTGRLDDSRRHARQVESLARALGAQPAITLAQAIRATASVWARGRPYAAEAVALVEEATGAVPAAHSWWTASATGLLAQARLLAGDAAGCRRTIVEGGGGGRLPLVRPFSRPLLLSLLAVSTLDCGDHQEARRLVGIAEAEAERLGLPVQEAYARCARARLHAADGEHDAAAKLFELAAEAFRSADMPVEYAWTLVTSARSVHASQGGATALGRLDAAEAIARAHGAGLVEERVKELRAELAEDGRAAHPVRLLSDREREIAALAASGLRTRQIAERLFLSPRTVETHLSRIYRKLDVSSRLALSDVLRAAPGR